MLLTLRFVIAMMSLLLLAGSGYVLVGVPFDPNVEKLVYAFLTGVISLTTTTVGWWFTSSLTASVAAATIANQSQLLAASTPGVPPSGINPDVPAGLPGK